MTAFSSSQLPATINSVEKGFVWFGGILYQLHSKSLYQESDLTGLVPRVASQIGLAADNREYLILRASIPLPPDWPTATVPLWQLAQDLADTPIPSGFILP